MSIFKPLAASSGSATYSAEGLTRVATPSTFRDTVSETRTQRYIPSTSLTAILNIVPYIVHYIIAYIVRYTTPNSSDRLILRGQDCVCLVAPYPFRLEPLEEFNHLLVQ